MCCVQSVCPSPVPSPPCCMCRAELPGGSGSRSREPGQAVPRPCEHHTRVSYLRVRSSPPLLHMVPSQCSVLEPAPLPMWRLLTHAKCSNFSFMICQLSSHCHHAYNVTHLAAAQTLQRRCSAAAVQLRCMPASLPLFQLTTCECQEAADRFSHAGM